MPRLLLTFLLATSTALAAEPIKESWDYAPAMKRVLTGFQGKAGVVIHVGDSITYANPYSQWARAGAGKTPAQEAALKWMHTNENNDLDGWYLCRFDHPQGGRSYTAAGGLRADELLQGGKAGLPALKELLAKYQPQVVVVMLGTNDASAQRKSDVYLADMKSIVDLVLGNHAVCVLTTIPPHIGQPELARTYNEGLRALAKSQQIPLIDYEAEILKRRPEDWNGTLLNKNDVHPTATGGDATPTSAPTDANLKNSGYLLRGWLTVDKLREVKERVIDAKKDADVSPAPTSQSRPQPAKPPAGEVVRVPINRDAWFSNVGDEGDTNTGGAPRLKLKSNQEFPLVDIDPKPLQGRKILAATLHLKLAASEILRRVTVGSVAAEWIEGTSQSYAVQPGSSSFRFRVHPQKPWSYPGSDLSCVTLGNGNTWWWMADAFPPDAEGWQRIAVEPALIAARVAGVSKGFVLFDDTGSEWIRDGEKVTLRHMPNRLVHSRESDPKSAPYFTVTLGPADSTAPGLCGELRIDPETAALPAGEAMVSWTTPADTGTGTVGFLAEIDGQPVPQYLVPMAAPAGQRVQMHVRDLSLEAGTPVSLKLRAIDGAGNSGPASTLRFKTSSLAVDPLPGTPPESLRAGTRLPKLGSAEVAVIDALDKLSPTSGTFIPLQTPAYLLGNHLWSAREPLIQLHAARNEFVDFQIVVRGEAGTIKPSLTFKTLQPQVSFGELRHVPTPQGPLPDPVVPAETIQVPSPAEKIDRQRSGSLLCEVYVPHGAPAGLHNGTLTLSAEGNTLEIPVTLKVWDFTLPDTLSFLPEMNCYGLPENEREYYRLAHRHRTVLNRVPYSQRGEIDDGCAPEWNGRVLDFARWDQRFGQYFDGTAFADLPRKGVPIECFYLPLNENWPTPIEPNFNGSYWADEAFPAEYRQAFSRAVEGFASHFAQQKWDRTLFQAFLNNKVDYKSKGWSRASSPWLLDEPSSFHDYWALRFFGEAVREGLQPGDPRIVFRADISRPQWQRDSLDPVLDYNVVAGGPFRQYRRMVLDRKQRFGQIVVDYGSTNAIPESNVQPAAWCLGSWTLGSDGVVPWQTVGNINSWRNADPLALFYPGGFVDREEPVPSIRLKAYRRGQQDVEYLTLLTRLLKQPRWVTAQQAREALRLSGKSRGTGFTGAEDAGLIEFSQLRPVHLWALRLQVGDLLSRRRAGTLPPTADWHPKRQNRVAQGGYVTVGEVPGPSELLPPGAQQSAPKAKPKSKTN